MGIVRDLYYARKIGAGTKLPAPTVALLVKRLALAAGMGGDVVATVSGNPVHITNALNRAALSVLATISPIQDLNGYDHPWPAGGGVNKLPCLKDGTYSGNGVTAVVKDGVATFSGTTTASGNAFSIPLDEAFDVPNQTCYLHLMNSYSDGSVAPSFESSTDVGNTTLPLSLAPINRIAIIPTNRQGVRWDRVRFYLGNGVTLSGTFAPMVCLTDEAIPFSPYSNICPISGRTGLSVFVGPTTAQADATTYAVDWTSEAGTVYGGTVDVVTGEMVATYGMVDMGTLTWSYSAEDAVFYAMISSKIGGDANISCSQYKSGGNTGYETPDYTIGYSTAAGYNAKRVFISDPRFTTAAAFKTAMSGVQLCYLLATPLTYQLTPQEVELLLGENYVWSSAGDTVSVTYYAEGNANTLQSLNILLGGNYSNPKTADDVSDKEALEIILGGNK